VASETNPEVLYWDSCTYLDYLKGDEHPLHAQMQMVIEGWREGKVTLVTSALTITEVLWVKCSEDQARSMIDRSWEPKIVALFDPPHTQPLKIVELNRVVARAARELVWDHGIKPKDAVHVASALAGHCHMLHTNDTKLHKFSGKLGGTPKLRIEPPSWIRQMTLENGQQPS